ncbi:MULTISPECIES: type IV pilus assembly protein FimV [Methylocaldum]|jgi:hypothetical protein|uniref:type IV pilus assembly protein FimV n=1 Tax=unclassified Methylocaldum TaxID=2622260 RepID=UPI00098B9594|nr:MULTISPECIES: hypothetical protein [unclassified Methylocaldum]MBP1149220.1 hypothetical protein [Methylocaldum sp. RMAD-M]MDV3242668.1 hypothetical protein [Methylocaldum sp.]
MVDYLSQAQRPALPRCGEAGPDVGPGNFAEPAFLIEDSLQPNPLCLGTENDVADYLAHSVSAVPDNLLRHTQRVLHHYHQNDRDGLYAALLDLFIALEHRGPSLRKRLLTGARDRLRKDCYARLDRWLECGNTPDWAELPPAGQSVLAPGVIGSLNLVQVSIDASDEERDPLVEAREHIEYSQIDQARAVLEGALFRLPERTDLLEELLLLYRATGDLDNFLHTREKLRAIMDPLPAIWDECERYLRKEHTP